MTLAAPATRLPLQLSVNGRAIATEAEPRTHLADLLREELGLTGTHLGCEHGVCGACTVEIDGAPARACLAFAPTCEGAAVTTVEGLDDDPVAIALRAAFTAEHALQCGFCTPGMLISARDLVLRQPEADEAAVREAMAGNLCRCTGYRGIVRAVLRVLAERRASPPVAGATPPLPSLPESGAVAGAAPPAPSPAAPPAPETGGERIRQVVELPFPPEAVWQALSDPVAVAGCVPGLEVTEARPDGMIRALFRVKLGPVGASFAGEGQVIYNAAERSIRVSGQGADRGGPSRVSGMARLSLSAPAPGRSRLEIEASHRLTGLLAQFSRGALVATIANRLTAEFARNLEARLAGQPAPAPRPAGLALLWQAVLARLRSLLGRSA